MNDILKDLKKNIDDSILDVNLKEWFNDNMLNVLIADSGLDWSGTSDNLDTLVEYYVLTKEENNDYRIVYSDKLSKFGLESRGTVKSNDKFNGQFVKFIMHWMDSPIELLESM